MAAARGKSSVRSTPSPAAAADPADARGLIRCAVVGLGRIGSLLEDDPLREKPCTHAGAIADNADCVLVGGCDSDPERRERFAERWSCDAVYADIGHLLQETRPHILCVATHPDSHRRYVEQAVLHSVAVVVCEKPIADTVRNARAIAKLHRKRRVTVVTNHERRYSADYQHVRDAIVERRFGRLLAVRGTLYFGKTQRHDRVLLHDGTHMVDVINYLLGSRLRIRGRFGRMRSRRGSLFLSATAGRVPVVIEVGAERDHLLFEVELSFERGRIRVGNGVYAFDESVESPYYEGYRSLQPAEQPGVSRTGFFAGMLADAVACVRDPGREPVSSARDGLATMRFIVSTRSRF